MDVDDGVSKRDRREIAEFIDGVRERIWAWDPVRLVDLGVPDDEYDCLVGPVTGGLREGLSPAALSGRLEAFVRGHFGQVPQDAYEFANSIVNWYRESGKPSSFR